MSSVFNFLMLLRPYDSIHLKKVRVGNSGDGGYVMLEDFEKTTALSFGVGDEISWDNDMVKRGGGKSFYLIIQLKNQMLWTKIVCSLQKAFSTKILPIANF